MKIKISLTFLVLVFVFAAHAQDILIKKNGDEIRCKVLELTPEKIVYSSQGAVDSLPPETLEVKKAEVFMIRYQNGTKDVFNASPAEDSYVAAAPKEEFISEKIEVEGRKFYYHHRRLGKSRLYKLLRKDKDEKIDKLVSKSVVCSIFAPILKFASIPAGVFGIILVGIETNKGNNNNFNPPNEENKNIGIACLSGFILAQAGGYTVEYFQYKNLKEAAKLYNEKHQ
jgi:hypothetical protein